MTHGKLVLSVDIVHTGHTYDPATPITECIDAVCIHVSDGVKRINVAHAQTLAYWDLFTRRNLASKKLGVKF